LDPYNFLDNFFLEGSNLGGVRGFALVVDGTTDITIQEQKSIVVRYVDENLVSNEVFLGCFAQSNGTTGEALTAMIHHVLLRLGLPLANLRGQTYDGASSMSGKYNGTQALIARQQPLYLYVHCLMHAGNLVVQEAMEASNIIQDQHLSRTMLLRHAAGQRN
jgi:hypothetical protein